MLTWLVIIGGLGSIGRAAERLSPLKVGLYLAGGSIVIVTHAARIPDVLALVFREAFSLQAAAGSAAGVGMMVAIRYGLARGIYANEAGYGTAAVAYGTARADNPRQQGLNAIIEVFVVSFVTSTISALAHPAHGRVAVGARRARRRSRWPSTPSMPVVGGWVVAFCVFLFGYTTLIGWAYYGEQFLEYLLGRSVTLPYRWIYCLLIPFGAIARVDVVWAWGDLMNALQIFPNLIGLVGLSGIAAQVAREGGTHRRPEPEVTRVDRARSGGTGLQAAACRTVKWPVPFARQKRTPELVRGGRSTRDVQRRADHRHRSA